MECNENKEVFWGLYCATCEHFANAEADDPCDECLDTFTNVNSHKPVMYKQKTTSSSSSTTTTTTSTVANSTTTATASTTDEELE